MKEDLNYIDGPFKLIRLLFCFFTGGHKMKETYVEKFEDIGFEYRHSACKKCGYKNYIAKRC